MRRIERVRKALMRRRLDALYLTNGTSMFYLTGYSFISTERPAALIIPADGKITFLGPRLEKVTFPSRQSSLRKSKLTWIIQERNILLSILQASLKKWVSPRNG